MNIIEQSINKLFNKSIDHFIFIYTPPKVGSTTLVTSLRISLENKYNIIHIHDEVMLSVLTGINNIKITDLINYLGKQKKNIYVIDVYRTPVERKISEFFEKISPYHFNNTPENISKYSIKRICDRFNKIFPYIENGDHYFDKYDISHPKEFDFDKKYTIQTINTVKYIKIRLCDSNLWANILSSIFNKDIVIINDYTTENKEIGQLFKTFKREYKIPYNYFELIKNDKYLNFYYNEIERNNYLSKWYNKITEKVIPYTIDEFNFYMKICLENQYICDVDREHYIDNNCFCEYCSKKRKKIYLQAKNGVKIFDKMVHETIIKEAHQNKFKYFNNPNTNIFFRITN